MGCVRRVGINPRGGPTDYSTDSPRLPHADPSPPFPLMMPWTDEKKEEGILCLQRGGKKSPGDTARTTVFPRY